jgi:hypothetical protein
MEYPEKWKSIPGYEGCYEVSSYGSVRSLDRLLIKPAAIRGYPRKVRGTILRPGMTKGYYFVLLSNHEGVKKSHYVADLVALAFIGQKPDGFQTCHNDGDPTNNVLFNLRYDTRKNNNLDKYKHGTVRYGELTPTSKLTEREVMEILSIGWSQPAVDTAKVYGVTGGCIQSILTGKTWRHLGGHRCTKIQSTTERWEGEGEPRETEKEK